MRGRTPIDLSGLTFGLLTAIKIERKPSNKKVYWLCRCSCGRTKLVITSDLTHGKVKSCGCATRGMLSRAKETHSEAGSRNSDRSPEYSVWASMKARCLNANVRSYPNYGGRGIKVCRRWKKFENFLADMGRRPTNRHQLERIDNDGNYEPSNCVWATRKAQANNKRNNRKITFNGECLTITEWAKKIGVKRVTLTYRLIRGWSVERALTTAQN